jgi:DNA-damage-inducible protein D
MRDSIIYTSVLCFTGVVIMLEQDYWRYAEGLENTKHTAPNGTEYWMARELMPLLSYTAWQKFERAVERARMACRESKFNPDTHFIRAGNMVEIGSGALRERADWYLTRYASYLIAMNADSRKPEVSFAMTYFAGETRKQELLERLIEEDKRLQLRLRIADNNNKLVRAAKRAGVEHFAYFHDGGYRGMYTMSIAELRAYRGLGPNENVLDRAGRLELAANDFRITLTEERLRRNSVRDEATAIRTHQQVGAEVRASVTRENGKSPESFPMEPSIKPRMNKHKKQLRGGAPD